MFQFFSKKGVPEKSARSSATPSASTADSSPSRTPSTAATVASIPISSLLGTLAFPAGVGCGSIPVLSVCDASVAAESVGTAPSADASSALAVDTHNMSSPCASSSVSSAASVATELPSSATEPLAACSHTVCSALDTSVSAAAEVAHSEALPETAPSSLAKTTLEEEATPHVLQEASSNSTDVATSTSTASEPTAVPVADASTTAASTASATAKETKLSKKPDRGMISSLPKILGSKTKEEFETENKRMREDLSSLRKKLVESQETCAQLKEAVATVKRILASGTTWSNDQPASITPTAVQSVFCYLENFDVSASFSRNLGRGSVRQKRADESSGGSAGDKERKGGRRAAGVGDRRDAGGRRRGGQEATGGTREGKLRAVYRMRQNNPNLGDDAGESGNERIGDSAPRKGANRAIGRKGSSDKKSKRGQWTEANSSSANGGTAKGSRYSYVVKSPTAEQQDKTLAVKELLREAGTVEDMEIAIRKAQEAEMNFEVQLALKKLVKIKKDLATVH